MRSGVALLVGYLSRRGIRANRHPARRCHSTPGFLASILPEAGLGYFDVRVIEIYELVNGIEGNTDCFPDFAFGARNQEILEAMDESTRSASWVSTKS